MSEELMFREVNTEAPAPDAPAPSVNWQTAFRLKADLRQKDIYAFETELRLLEKSAPAVNTVVAQSLQVMRTIGMTVDASIESEHHLKAAIKAGLIEAPTWEVATVHANGATGGKQTTRYFLAGENVDEMHPGKVRWYGKRINLAYQKAVEIPDPN